MKLVKCVIVLDGNPGGCDYHVGDGKIARIEDVTAEYEDHSETILHCYDNNGNLLRSIINCPVDIEYLTIQ